MYASHLIVSSLLLCTSFLAADAVSCQVPYEDIGNRCMLVDVNTGGTWEEMSTFCEGILQGSLLRLDSLTLYSNLLYHLDAKGLSKYSFWTDATDSILEGHFFHNNGYAVEMGTPYWAYTCFSQQECQQEPLGGVQENCVEMDGTRFHYLNDVSCDEYKNVICQR